MEILRWQKQGLDIYLGIRLLTNKTPCQYTKNTDSGSALDERPESVFYIGEGDLPPRCVLFAFGYLIGNYYCL